ncbi:MAG: MBL fold metallo-hydrolase [Ardenticatenaceae bacterium]|nr:MBL fold metallo-hydrolase [Ardenticatenaceae bacterium]
MTKTNHINFNPKTGQPIPLNPWFVNSYLVRGEHGHILVDTGFPQDQEKIWQALQKNGVGPEEIKLILLTHGHVDHFGGAAAFRQMTQAPIALHGGDLEQARLGRNNPVYSLTLFGRIGQLIGITNHTAQGIEPDILFEGNDSLEKIGLAGRIIHTPGHSPGSVSLILPGQAAVIGDLLSGNPFLRNRPNWPHFAETPRPHEEILNSVAHLLESEAQLFYVGHGRPFNRAALEKWFDQQGKKT